MIEQFDLGWDVVHATNPRAVMVRMPAFGLDGPWRDRPGFAQTMEQVTGLAWLTGHVDDQPRIQRGPCDPNGGMHAVVGALVALELRDRTGVGSLVESTMFEAALNISRRADRRVDRRTATRSSRDGSRSPWAAPQGVYATDTPRAVARGVGARPTSSGRRWSTRSGGPTGRPIPTLATHAGRRAAHDLLDEKLGAWAADTDLDKAVDLLARRGRPGRAGGRRPRARREHPQFVARGYYEDARPPGHRRAGAPVGAVPLRQRRPLGPHARRRRSASTTTRSSPTSASPTTRSPRSRPTDVIGDRPARTVNMSHGAP